MSQFIESIKIENGEIFLLNLHQIRVNQVFANFGKTSKIDLEGIYRNLKIEKEGIFKLRIVYDLEGNFTSEISPYFFPEIKNFTLVENNFIDYQFKFSNRKIFEEMKSSAGSEIIIVKNGQITDTSFSNLIFLKDEIWYTPKTFLLNGVQRQNLLQKKAIKEAEINLQNLKEFSHFQIINAMNDFDEMFIYPIEKIINLPENESYLEL